MSGTAIKDNGAQHLKELAGGHGPVVDLVNHPPKNIIYDVGYVLIEYRWIDVLSEGLGISYEEAQRIGDEIFGSPYWKLYDLGTVTDEDLIRGYAMCYPDDAEAIEWFIRSSEQLPVGRPAVWAKVHELHERGYKQYLLSNYPEKMFRQHTDGKSLMQDIDGMVVSYQYHMAKPDPRIFHKLLDLYGLKAEECLYFDDLEANTAGGRRVGIPSRTVRSERHLLCMLDELP